MVNWKKKEKCKESKCNEVWRDFCGECNSPICQEHILTIYEEDERGVGWMVFCKECFDVYIKEIGKNNIKKIGKTSYLEKRGDK